MNSIMNKVKVKIKKFDKVRSTWKNRKLSHQLKSKVYFNMTEQLELTTEQVNQLNEEIKNLDVILTKIELHKASVKESISALSEELDVPKKLLNKMLKVYHKNNFLELVDEESKFQDLYESIISEKE